MKQLNANSGRRSTATFVVALAAVLTAVLLSDRAQATNRYINGVVNYDDEIFVGQLWIKTCGGCSYVNYGPAYRLNGATTSFTLNAGDNIVIGAYSGDNYVEVVNTIDGYLSWKEGGMYAQLRPLTVSYTTEIYCEGGADEIHGSDRADEIEAGAGSDIVYGRGGSDYIMGVFFGCQTCGSCIDTAQGLDLCYGDAGSDHVLCSYLVSGGTGADSCGSNGSTSCETDECP